jgi:AmmeMemoRadiSam system protein B/AmmeMemoRadiSam system protein A
MRAVLIALLSILIPMEIFSQNKSTDRQPVVAGSFYTANKEALTKEISEYFTECKKSPASWKVRAIICPHAGYVYSGKIAASAFSATPRNAQFKNIFIIGSSHIMEFEGASVYNTGDFITPLGKAIVNREIANKLKNENKVFEFPVDAHRQEHSLEVQIPFIQYYYTNKPMIVPIIVGHTNNTATIKKIANALKPWFTPDNLFVISSDFSHYPSYKDAVETDNITATGIVSGDPLTFLNGLSKNESRKVPGLVTSMCGWTSGLTLLDLAEGNDNLEFKRIDYCNSGDSPYGDKYKVVGYHSIALIEKISATEVKQKSSDSFSFTRDETDQLFDIARNSIKTMLYENKRVTIDENKFPANLNKQMGAFVTLKIDSTLRGCIGRFVSSDPLCEVVNVSALSSAFEDPRFPPLTKEEYSKTDIEITVLGPMKKINSINEIILGKHGIFIKKDYRSGTMLPQVATENGWTLEQFLGYTSRDKAGLGWEGWKEAEIYIYEGVVLEENRK